MKLLRINPKQRSQNGDTIVEVIIAIAIVSAVLVGAFLVSNHSTQAVRDSEEHAEAQQILQGQVELLRAYVQAQPGDNLGTTAFCMTSTDQQSSNLSGCDGTSDLANFHEILSTKQTTSTSDVYDCYITWDSIEGGTAKEEFFYRVYPAS